jgi:hypothetical protein
MRNKIDELRAEREKAEERTARSQQGKSIGTSMVSQPLRWFDRTGKTAGLSLDWLCARQAAAA